MKGVLPNCVTPYLKFARRSLTAAGVSLASWRGTALWHNRPINVLILEADGNVTIEELSRGPG